MKELSRRGFLGAILAAGAAPAIVKAESLMKVFVPPVKVLIANRSVSDVPIGLGKTLYTGEIGRYEGFRVVYDELTYYPETGLTFPTEDQIREIHVGRNGSWKLGSYSQAMGRIRRENPRQSFVVVHSDANQAMYDALIGKRRKL